MFLFANTWAIGIRIWHVFLFLRWANT